MSTSGSKSNEHMAHFLVDIHNYMKKMSVTRWIVLNGFGSEMKVRFREV